MGQEVQFRSAVFGGFHKDDVLEYIRALQTELLEKKMQLESRESLVPALKHQIKELEEELETQQLRNREYTQINDDYARRILTLSQERDDLETKYKNLESGCEKLQDVEGQVGSLILDALLYAEKIIERAKEASGVVAENAKQTIRSSVQEVDGLGEDITKFSLDFSDTLTNLAQKINTLSVDLGSVADKLQLPEEDEQQFEFDEGGYPVLRAARKAAQEQEQSAQQDYSIYLEQPAPQPQEESEQQDAAQPEEPIQQEQPAAVEAEIAQPEEPVLPALELEDALSFLMGQLEQNELVPQSAPQQTEPQTEVLQQEDLQETAPAEMPQEQNEPVESPPQDAQEPDYPSMRRRTDE